MEYRVTWSPEAVKDMESIAEYIARDFTFYARSVVSKVIEVAGNIGEFRFGKYRVIYETYGERKSIKILHIGATHA